MADTANVVINGITYSDVPSIIVKDTSDNDVTFSLGSGGGGGVPKMGILRPDAELVQTWASDTYAVADEGLEIPAYTTTAQTLKATENIATYDGTPSDYRYVILERMLTIPEYDIDTKAKGRLEYVLSVASYEWVYNPSGELATLDGSKTYGQYSQMVAHAAATRYVYWSSASAIAPYTSTAYGFYQTVTAPTITSNKTITIKSPVIGVRGHTTYFSSTFMNALTDARLQYVIELWRIPVADGVTRGFTHESQIEHVINNIKNNGGTLT